MHISSARDWVFVKTPARILLAIAGVGLVALGSLLVFIERDHLIDSPGLPLVLAGWIGIIKAITSGEPDSNL